MITNILRLAASRTLTDVHIPQCLPDIVGLVLPKFVRILDDFGILLALRPGQGRGGEAQDNQLQTKSNRRQN